VGEDPGQGSPGGRFPTTRWTLVLAAGRTDAAESRAAIVALCDMYWRPLYQYARSRGSDPDEAGDLVQGLFLTLLSRNYFANLRPEKGRLRAYLKTALKNYASGKRDEREAEIHGGGTVHVPLDLDIADEERRYVALPVDRTDPEALYNRRWALRVLDAAVRGLEERYRSNDQLEQFRYLVRFLDGDEQEGTYTEAAARLGFTVSAVKMSVHRLRERFRQELRELIADTVADASEIEDEIRFLFASLGRA
jgi:RNA polymerase sigma factor (sigma-70 family)